MKYRQLFLPEDSTERAHLLTWIEFSVGGLLLAFAAIYFGVGLSQPISLLRAFLWALAIVAAGNLLFMAAFRGVRTGVDGLFGRGRLVDQKELTFESLRDLAEAQDRRGEHKEAAAHYRQMMESPQNKKAAFTAYRLAEIYAHHLGRPDDAIYWYRKAMALVRSADPDHYTEHSLWPELQRGLALFTNAKVTDDEDFGERIASLKTMLEEKRLDEAYIQCADLLRRYPHRADAWFWAALVEVRRGLPARAIDHYYQAIERDEHHLRALFNLAMLLVKEDRLVEGRERLERYLAEAEDEPAEKDFVIAAKEKLTAVKEELTSSIDTAVE